MNYVNSASVNIHRMCHIYITKKFHCAPGGSVLEQGLCRITLDSPPVCNCPNYSNAVGELQHFGSVMKRRGPYRIYPSSRLYAQ